MNLDFIINGQAQGSTASRLLAMNGDTRALRPWLGEDGRSYIGVTIDGKEEPVPVQNATATLRKDEWIQLDTAILKAAKPRLKLVANLRAAGLTYSIPNGLGKTVLQHQAQSDINEASISMDGLKRGDRDRPHYDITNLPLPIIHKDFSFSLREILASRNAGSPLDTTVAELAARRVAESVEKLATGTFGQYSFGGGTVYGVTNFPSRITHTVTAPTTSGWTPSVAVTQVLEMMQKSRVKKHYGPWKLYVSSAWDGYMDRDYSTSYAGETLRSRLQKINGITGIDTLDYLETVPGAGSGFVMILVQMTPEVVREVIGLELQTLQWETEGGLEIHYKVMCVMVPQLRKDFYGNTGIVHGA